MTHEERRIARQARAVRQTAVLVFGIFAALTAIFILVVIFDGIKQ